MGSFKAWLGQVTTGHGFMILAPTLMAAMTGQMPWSMAAPLLASAAVGLVWPENKALAMDAEKIAGDAANMLSARRGVPILLLIGAAASLVLAACTPATDAKVVRAMATPPGRLFCMLQTAGGGAFLANVLDAQATGAAPGLAPVFVMATDAGKQAVDDDCAKAAAAANAVSGNPVSPPIDPAAVVATVAVVAPSSPTKATN